MRDLIRRVLTAGLLAMLGTAGARAQAGPEWDKLVAAAKAEGSVTLYTGLVGNPTSAKIAAAFKDAYGIRVDVLEVRATELRERIRTEAVSKRVLGDVMNTSGVQTREIAEGDGTIEAVGPLPNLATIRKEVEPSWEARDINVPIFTLHYGLLVNKALAPQPPRTYADLADPRWKGKILSDDFRAAGGGQTFFSVTYTAFGRAFHDKLAANGVTFTRDQREAERRVARGEYAIYLPFLLNYFPSLKGLPVEAVVLEEGVTYTPYSASIIRNSSHPHAARLLVDFMLSRQAQGIYAAEGLGPVVDGLAGKAPAELRSLGQPKLLGARAMDREDRMSKLASEIYK